LIVFIPRSFDRMAAATCMPSPTIGRSTGASRSRAC